MSLLSKISKITVNQGIVRISGCLKQFGAGGAILNADINGEQKTTENYSGETVPKISPECLTNGIFKHRIKNLPVSAYKASAKGEDSGDEKKKSKSKGPSLEPLKELFEALKKNRVEYRGGAIMTDGTMNAEKSFRVDEAIPFDNNKDYFTVENRRLGVKGDSGENDYPRQQILYKNLKFFVSSYLDLRSFNPNNNRLVYKFLEQVDLLSNDKEENLFKKEVETWLDQVYPLNSEGELNIDTIIANLVKEFTNYEHPVHRRFNSFLLMTKVSVEKIQNREELEHSLSLTKHHHGIK